MPIRSWIDNSEVQYVYCLAGNLLINISNMPSLQQDPIKSLIKENDHLVLKRNW